jgi:hypothetical protein
MPSGFSGSYGINGVALTLQPSEGRWEAKSTLGRDGEGRPIYPAIGEFTLSWGLMSTSEFKQLNDVYLSVSNSGTVVSELPKWGDVDYLYYAYSGTIVDRPTVGAYFVGYVSDVRMTIGKIRV